ncbi:MAG TPA: copper resistance protein CopC [Symbiobacteriaceae bacterium]|jgi:copper transport protein
MPNRLKPLLLAVLVVGLSLLSARPADAHAFVVSSKPGNGEKLVEAPGEVEVRFNEPVTAEFTPLVVRDDAGARVDVGDARLDPQDPTLATVSLKPLRPGFYTVVYRITSLDGHPVEGAIAFSVGAVTGTGPAGAGPVSGGSADLWAGLVHGLVQLLAALLAGLTAFLLCIWLPVAGSDRRLRVERWATVVGVLFLLAGVADVSLYAVRASGEGFSPGLLAHAYAATRVGRIWLLRTGVALIAGSALGWSGSGSSGWKRIVLLIPGAFLLMTLTMQSHAMATRQMLPFLADWMHLLAVSTWLGGLAGFGLVTVPVWWNMAPEERKQLLGRAVPHFSRAAAGAVLLLTVTGLYMALLQIPTWALLFTTRYGQALLVKLILLMPALGLGGYNLLQRGSGAFGRAVRTEVVLVLGIFIAAGFLSILPPAQVEFATRSGAFEANAISDGYKITLKMQPNQVGINFPVVTLADARGIPEQGAGVAIRIVMITHDMGVQNLTAREQSPGVYKGDMAVLGMDGEWQVEVSALTRSGREIRRTFQIKILPPLVR